MEKKASMANMVKPWRFFFQCAKFRESTGQYYDWKARLYSIKWIPMAYVKSDSMVH